MRLSIAATLLINQKFIFSATRYMSKSARVVRDGSNNMITIMPPLGITDETIEKLL
jgi:hypothetical protein